MAETEAPHAACRVCTGPTREFARTTVLGDVPASFLRCRSCAAVQVDDPSWLDQAYDAPITRLDIGLLDRCLLLSNVTAAIVRAEGLRDGRFLDWAGGYGALTRLMRDRGFDFVHDDPMTPNLFAAGREGDPGGGHYDMVTGFEVLEHLVDPVGDLQAVAASTDRLLMTTQLLPDPAPLPEDWWYYTLETGQHITLYTPRSLEALAHRLGFDGVVSGSFLHLFYRGRVRPLSRRLVARPQIAYGLGWGSAPFDRRSSLLGSDLAALRKP